MVFIFRLQQSLLCLEVYQRNILGALTILCSGVFGYM